MARTSFCGLALILGGCALEPPPVASSHPDAEQPVTHGERDVQIARGWAADVESNTRNPLIPATSGATTSEAACPDGLLTGLIGGTIEAITGTTSSPGCSGC